MVEATIVGLISIVSNSLALIKRLNPDEKVSKELETIETSITNISNNYGTEINGSNITINGDITQNTETNEIKAIEQRPKYKFSPTNDDIDFHFRDEYNEVLEDYDRVSGNLWTKKDTTKWAIDNNYRIGYDFAIDPPGFFPMSTPGAV